MINIETSVFKRYDASPERVHQHLINNGFEPTGQIMDGRIHYHENGGINLTMVDGPFGVIVFPSGPVRGAIFGKNAVGAGRTSLLDRVTGDGISDDEDSEMTSSRGRDSQFSV